MIRETRHSPELYDAVHDFVTAGINDEMTDRQLAEFERLLNEHPEARDLYVDYVEASVFLPRVLAGIEKPHVVEDIVGARPGYLSVTELRAYGAEIKDKP